jgi:CubicO group peptidase (beta-lactamase class C family)
MSVLPVRQDVGREGVRKMNHTFRRSCFMLFLVVAGLAPAQDRQASIWRVENGLVPPVRIQGDKAWNILERMKFYGVPGVSVAVFADHKILWAKGYGVTDAEAGQPVTEKTLFIAGSVSKPVAVMGALRLVQEGKLALDENINDFLTSWKLPDNEFTKTQKVTLRRIMSHSAGLTVHGFPGYAAGQPVPTLVQILNGTPPANTAAIRVDTVPGTIWRYSGGGLTIMQQAMIDIEKRPFPALMEDLVLRPLGMTSSSYEQDLSPDRLALAASGHSNGKVIDGKRHRYPEMAAAGLWTTPTDLVKFAIEVELEAAGKSNTVLSPESARLMVTPQISVDKTGDMALGLFLERHGQSVYIGHGGADAGFICQLIASRDGGYGAAVMTNSETGVGPLIGEILRSIAVEYQWKDYVAPPVVPVALSPKELEGFAGRYLISSDDVLSVRVRGRALEGKTTGMAAFELVPAAKNEFVCRDEETRFVFAKPEGGKSESVALRTAEGERPALRVADDFKAPFEMLLAGDIEGAVGAYESIRKKNPKDEAVDENRLNRLGYNLMGEKKLKEAIAVFRLNVELYPASWNVYDSLGEAYMISGNKELAIKNYEKSLELNPQNTGGLAMLKKLRGQ